MATSDMAEGNVVKRVLSDNKVEEPAKSDRNQGAQSDDRGSRASKQEHFLLVTGLSKDTGAVQLKEFFKQHGKIGRFSIMTTVSAQGGRQRFVHVQVSSKDRLNKLVKATNGKWLHGSRLTVAKVPEDGPLSRKYVLAGIAPTTTLPLKSSSVDGRNNSSETLILTEDVDDFLLATGRIENSEGITPDSTQNKESELTSKSERILEDGEVQESNEAEARKMESDRKEDIKEKRNIPPKDRPERKSRDRDRGVSSRQSSNRKRKSSERESWSGGSRENMKRKRSNSSTRSRPVIINRIRRSPKVMSDARTMIERRRNKSPRRKNGKREHRSHKKVDQNTRRMARNDFNTKKHQRRTDAADQELARLARENEKLCQEREEIEREKEELLLLERKRQRLERQQIAKEREEIRKAKQRVELEQIRQENTASRFSASTNYIPLTKFSPPKSQRRRFPENTIAQLMIEKERHHRKPSEDVRARREISSEPGSLSCSPKLQHTDGGNSLGVSSMKSMYHDERKTQQGSWRVSPQAVENSFYTTSNGLAGGRQRETSFDSSDGFTNALQKQDDQNEFQRQTKELWTKLNASTIPQTMEGRSHNISGINMRTNASLNIPLLPQAPSQALLGTYPGWTTQPTHPSKLGQMSFGHGMPSSWRLNHIYVHPDFSQEKLQNNHLHKSNNM